MKYQPELFVNRKSELALVDANLRTQLADGPVDQKVLMFRGVAGLGKTWMLQEIERKYKAGAGVVPVYYDLAAHAQVEIPSGEQIPLILLDNADKAEAWEEIEKGVLEPLVTSRKTLIVATENKPVRWKRFEVRRRLSETHSLEPFDHKTTRLQIYKLGEVENLEQHFEVLRSHPALALSALRFGLPVAIDDWAGKIVGELPENGKKALTAVLPLRYFRIESMRTGWQREFPQDKVDHPDGFFLNVIRDLEDSGIARWSRPNRAYVLDTAARLLLNHKLRMSDPGSFDKSHSAALEMYSGWSEEYPFSCEDFIAEAIFHATMVFTSNRNRKEFSARVSKLTSFAREHLKKDSFSELRGIVESDKELLELLPEAEGGQILSQLAD